MKEIKPAERLDEIKEYYFSKKLREVAEMNARGLDVISLGVGGPDRPPHEKVRQRLGAEAMAEGTHGYQPHSGAPELRENLACWYRDRYGVNLDPKSEIQPLIGSKEGILHISLAFVNPGDEVLVPDPGYAAYRSITKMIGGVPVTYDLKEESGWLPDFDELERRDLSKVKIMWVNYPHMPTGTRPSRELLEKIVDFGRRHGILIVHDNPYSFILNPEPMSLLSVAGAKEVALEMNSLSKSHNMAGWRMGMVAGRADRIACVLKVKSNIDSGQFLPMMRAASEALALGQDWTDEVNRGYSARRQLVEKILEELGCTWDPAQVGLFVWAKIPDGYANGEQLADELLEKARVFVTPGSVFGTNGDSYIRLSLCAPEKRLEEALERVGKMKESK